MEKKNHKKWHEIFVSMAICQMLKKVMWDLSTTAISFILWIYVRSMFMVSRKKWEERERCVEKNYDLTSCAIIIRYICIVNNLLPYTPILYHHVIILILFIHNVKVRERSSNIQLSRIFFRAIYCFTGCWF